jgi:hypothetical protein
MNAVSREEMEYVKELLHGTLIIAPDGQVTIELQKGVAVAQGLVALAQDNYRLHQKIEELELKMVAIVQGISGK